MDQVGLLLHTDESKARHYLLQALGEVDSSLARCWRVHTHWAVAALFGLRMKALSSASMPSIDSHNHHLRPVPLDAAPHMYGARHCPAKISPPLVHLWE